MNADHLDTLDTEEVLFPTGPSWSSPGRTSHDILIRPRRPPPPPTSPPDLEHWMALWLVVGGTLAGLSAAVVLAVYAVVSS